MEYAISRKRMVEDQLRARGIKDEQVLQVMLKVPRHSFVDEGLVPMAYNNHPLSIGEGQTISQPYIVAYMVECLRLRPEDRILEVGTGCGYVTAISAELGAQVYSIERISALLMKARKNLKRLGYRNIVLKLGDGTEGWPQAAPFDAIIVSAASPEIPRPYLDQLAEGGRLILPVGGEGHQELVLVTKTKGKLSQETLSGCRFVKLMGKYGFHPS
jgi:protein-L-isoaspartate(D-aspartate) O-methyltransferase